MIKRLAALSLLLVYLGTTTGFALSLHFCGAKISNIRINQYSSKPCCTKDADTKPDKCCKDTHIKIIISDEQQFSQLSKIPAASNFQLFVLPPAVASATPHISAHKFQAAYRGPPSLSALPLTIKNCVFRI